jgi:hypothetical protein
MPQLKMLAAVLLVCAAGAVNAQSVDLSTGVAVLANGKDTNGNIVNLYDKTKHNNATYYYLDDPGAAWQGSSGINRIIADPKGSGFAAMQRNTRVVELGYSSYGSNSKYNGVIDWGITRDAKWSAAYIVTGATPSAWGNSSAVAGVQGFLKNTFGKSQVGYIDSYISAVANARIVYGTTAEIYGSSTINSNGVAYQAGLKHIDTGTGVIGSSAGLYYDEAGQYHMDASGHITYDGNGYPGNLSDKYGPSWNPAGAYDDWNQHGIVLTGADLIAYTTGFTANGTDTVIGGSFNVLGNFYDVYINGNKVDRSALNLTENLYGDVIQYGIGKDQGVVGEYTLSLDLSEIDASWWDANGENNISFLVETVTPYMLGLQANDALAMGASTNPYAYPYGIVAGFNYFSANIQYGSMSAVPEPSVMLMFSTGLLFGAPFVRRRMRKS